MAQLEARIRRLDANDVKLATFVIGKANMESLAVANNRVYTNPLSISLWLILSSIFIQYMEWWPNGQHGIAGYLRPLPALASMALPLMFLVDWINRPYFEDLVQEILRYNDMRDLVAYYSKPPASGFWILEYGDRFVGLLALDASPNAQVMASDKQKPTSDASRAAMIRHFYVDEAYRGSGIQTDLLVHAVQHAFKADSALQRIRAPDSPLAPYIRECLRAAGFHLDYYSKTVGILRWKLGMRVLEKEDWKKEAEK